MKIDSQAMKAMAHGSFSGKPCGSSVGFFTLLVLGWSMESPMFLGNPPLTSQEFLSLFLQVVVVKLSIKPSLVYG